MKKKVHLMNSHIANESTGRYQLTEELFQADSFQQRWTTSLGQLVTWNTRQLTVGKGLGER